MDTATIEREVLLLPMKQRAALVHKLLESLDEISEAENDQLWLDVAVQRAAEIDTGKVQLIPSEEVSRKARALFL